MIVTESIYSIATSNADLSALISTRCWPRGGIKKNPTLPFLTYQHITLPDDSYETHDNTSGRDLYAYQIDGIAENPHKRDQLKDAVFSAFQGYEDGDVGYIWVSNQIDSDAPRWNAWRVITEILIDHKR